MVGLQWSEGWQRHDDRQWGLDQQPKILLETSIAARDPAPVPPPEFASRNAWHV